MLLRKKLEGVSKSRHFLTFKPSSSENLHFLVLHENHVSLFELSKNLENNNFYLKTVLKSKLSFSKNNLLESSLFFNFKNHDYISLSSCDNKVHIYELNENTELNFLNHLQGHTNKIKEMTFTEINGNGYLASGSLDNYIRIWGFRPIDELESRYKKSKYVYYINDSHFVTLDSVLFGHTEAISGVKFFKDIQGKSNFFFKFIYNYKYLIYKQK